MLKENRVPMPEMGDDVGCFASFCACCFGQVRPVAERDAKREERAAAKQAKKHTDDDRTPLLSELAPEYNQIGEAGAAVSSPQGPTSLKQDMNQITDEITQIHNAQIHNEEVIKGIER